MKKTLKSTLFTILLLLFSVSTFSQDTQILSDSAQISLFTCSPGTEIYELFGHSGIRVTDKERGIDIVFNYGLFDFNQDDFVYRFVRGKTDYEVGMCPTEAFLAEYIIRGSGVKESVFNLTQEEKEKILLYLMDNIQPENKTYRYNFIFNNCATKLRDVIDQNVTGEKTFPDITGTLSFRDAVKLYTTTSPWSQFGFDLCLGRGMDREATAYEKMFLPEILGATINQTTVKKDDTTVNLVSKINVVAEQTLENPAPWISPLVLFIILCVLTFCLSMYCIWKHIKIRWFDAIIFGANALFGCVILFLILFSKHPFTYANFNIVWLNPLMCVPIAFLIFKKTRKFEFFYYVAVSVVLVLFLLGHTITEQVFNTAVYPLVTMYLIRSVSYVLNIGYRIGDKE